MSSTHWTELTRRQRRREVIATTVAVALTWILLFAIYYLIPFSDRTAGESLVRLVVGIAALGAVLGWQLRRVLRAERPGLRAVAC